jgi:hypothetical protein
MKDLIPYLNYSKKESFFYDFLSDLRRRIANYYYMMMGEDSRFICPHLSSVIPHT